MVIQDNEQVCCVEHCRAGLVVEVLFRMTLLCSVVSDSLVTLWTVARWAPLSVGFPRQEYWSVLPFPPPGRK